MGIWLQVEGDEIINKIDHLKVTVKEKNSLYFFH